MKNSLLLLLFLSIYFLGAQNDTIFRKEGSSISTRITLVTEQSIYYLLSTGDGAEIDLNEVRMYSQSGIRYDPQLVSSQIQKSKTTVDTVYISKELYYLKHCLRKGHVEFLNGTATMCFGITFTSFGTYLAVNEQSGAAPLLVIGSVLSTIGTIIMIDSHKWFGRAGQGVNGKGNEKAIYYKFK
jgi:hypothetical protein